MSVVDEVITENETKLKQNEELLNELREKFLKLCDTITAVDEKCTKIANKLKNRKGIFSALGKKIDASRLTDLLLKFKICNKKAKAIKKEIEELENKIDYQNDQLEGLYNIKASQKNDGLEM